MHSHAINPSSQPPLLPVTRSSCPWEDICSLSCSSTSFYLHTTQDPEGASLSSPRPGNRRICALLYSLSMRAMQLFGLGSPMRNSDFTVKAKIPKFLSSYKEVPWNMLDPRAAGSKLLHCALRQERSRRPQGEAQEFSS